MAFLFGSILFVNPYLFSAEPLLKKEASMPWPVYFREKISSGPSESNEIRASRPLSKDDLHEVLVTPDFSYSDLGDRRYVAATRKGHFAWELHLPPRTDVGFLHSERIGNALYIFDPNRSIYAVDARNGSIYWTHFTGELERPPALLGEFLYTAKELDSQHTRIVKMDRYSGQVLWQKEFGLSQKIQKIEANGSELKLILSSGDFKLDAQTGRSLDKN